METREEWLARKLRNYLLKSYPYFSSIKEFEESLRDRNWILEQIEWIENGTYGAGACHHLLQALEGLNGRTNNTVQIGKVVLRAFYGAEFLKWDRLSKKVQGNMNWAVNKWLEQEHDFAI